MTSIEPADLSTMEMHKLLLGSIVPRPIAFVSTIDLEGNVNLSPFSFFNTFSANPPVLVFSPSRRGRDGSTKHTLDNLREVPEAVVCIVTYSMVEQMSLSSSEYSKNVNEFKKAGFKELPSEVVRPPRVFESPVHFECAVQEIKELGVSGGAGNLVICDVLKLHFDESMLNESGGFDAQLLDSVGRMGGDEYVRASGDAVFQVKKPGRKPGIGIDMLPESIKESEILSGNDLGKLGSLPHLPERALIRSVEESLPFDLASTEGGDAFQLRRLHEYAKGLIEKGDIEKALCVLMATR